MTKTPKNNLVFLVLVNSIFSWVACAQAENIKSNANTGVHPTTEQKSDNQQTTKQELEKGQSDSVREQPKTKEKTQQNPDRQNPQGSAESTPVDSGAAESEQQEKSLDLNYDSSTVEAKKPIKKPVKKQKLPDFTRIYEIGRASCRERV